MGGSTRVNTAGGSTPANTAGPSRGRGGAPTAPTRRIKRIAHRISTTSHMVPGAVEIEDSSDDLSLCMFNLLPHFVQN